MIFHPLLTIPPTSKKPILRNLRILSSNKIVSTIFPWLNTRSVSILFFCLYSNFITLFAAPKIEIIGDNWGDVRTEEIEEVLLTAANLILPYSNQENWPTIRIENSVAGPMVLHNGERKENILSFSTRRTGDGASMFSSLLMNLVIFFVITKKIAHQFAGWRNPFVKWLLFLYWDKWKRRGNELHCTNRILSMLLNLPDTSRQESIWLKKSLMKNSNFGGNNDFRP